MLKKIWLKKLQITIKKKFQKMISNKLIIKRKKKRVNKKNKRQRLLLKVLIIFLKISIHNQCLIIIHILLSQYLSII